jgi:2-amino-4-hydroxy-6-hydroxymethyldihydropteridine diphosphokinase
MSSHIAYLVLGTNLGNRNKNLSNARLEINDLPQTRILKKSKIFKSHAYGPVKQPFFFNLALEVETELLPLELLDHFQQIEKRLKREKDSHMKPRTIDIDIVFFDNEKIENSRLKIPHYDWQNRDFFIKPLREINCQAEEFKNLKFA